MAKRRLPGVLLVGALPLLAVAPVTANERIAASQILATSDGAGVVLVKNNPTTSKPSATNSNTRTNRPNNTNTNTGR